MFFSETAPMDDKSQLDMPLEDAEQGNLAVS
jgi:hypothetical protein